MQSPDDWLDAHLIAQWRDLWSMLSVRLAAIVAAGLTALSSNPDLLLGIIAFIPADPVNRALMAFGVGFLTFVTPTLLRLWDQGAKDE